MALAITVFLYLFFMTLIKFYVVET